MARKYKAEPVSKRVQKLFLAHHWIIKTIGRQVAVYQVTSKGYDRLQTFDSVQEAKSACNII